MVVVVVVGALRAGGGWALNEDFRDDGAEVRVGASRLEEDELDGIWEEGAVDWRAVEGRVEARCEVGGRVVECAVVALGRRLLLRRGGKEAGFGGLMGESCALRFPRAFAEGGFGDSCSCAVSKLVSDDFEGEQSAFRATSLCCSSSIWLSRASWSICSVLPAAPSPALGGMSGLASMAIAASKGKN